MPGSGSQEAGVGPAAARGELDPGVGGHHAEAMLLEAMARGARRAPAPPRAAPIQRTRRISRFRNCELHERRCVFLRSSALHLAHKSTPHKTAA